MNTSELFPTAVHTAVRQSSPAVKKRPKLRVTRHPPSEAAACWRLALVLWDVAPEEKFLKRGKGINSHRCLEPSMNSEEGGGRRPRLPSP